MADVELGCPKCGLRVTVSEYVGEEGRICMACGGALQIPEEAWPAMEAAQASSGLRVRRRTQADAVSVRGDPLPTGAVGHAEAERVIPNAVADPKAGRSPWPRVIGVLVFLLTAALFIGPQFLADGHPAVRDAYLSMRYGAWALVWLIVVIDAWREGTFYGLGSLLFPPYALAYAVSRMESYWAKALVFATLIALAAELHFLGADASVHRMGAAVERGIVSVGNLIERAGDPTPF